MTYGATPDEWAHLSVMLGLTADLLPVVSNPYAVISPDSKMKGLGKTPSIYNGQHFVAGIPKWPEHRSTSQDIERWSKEGDYGICIQTRTVRAIDIDITDEEQATRIRACVGSHLGSVLAVRSRSNSSKCLVTFEMPGDFTKRVIHTAHGIIEFLATGQQFIACGTHPSGTRYLWERGLPDTVQRVESSAFELAWADLEKQFAIEPATTAKSSTKKEVLVEAFKSDPVAVHLLDHGLVLSSDRDGKLHILCPFAAEHTTAGAESATTYWPAHTGGYERGHFKCLHAHCEHRTDHDYLEALGLSDQDDLDFAPIIATGDNHAQTTENNLGFVVESGGQIAEALGGNQPEVKPPRYTFQRIADFVQSKPPTWLIKHVIPEAGVGVVFGDSGCGKTFFVIDVSAAIAEGADWRGHKTKQGIVAYVAAEGARGFQNRAQAYCDEHGVTLDNMLILADAPNFTDKADVGFVLDALRPHGRPALIVIDTLAQVMAGANENSGEDMGKVLKHCRMLNKATGAMILIVHHSGKDTNKGARGWSGLRAAADVEIEVERCDEQRSATVTKMKDGEDGASFAFELRVVVLGEDEDHEPITSCVVEATGGERVIKSKMKPLGENQKRVLNAVKELVSLADGIAKYEDVVDLVKPKMETKLDARGKDRRGDIIRDVVKKLADYGLLTRDGDNLRIEAAV